MSNYTFELNAAIRQEAQKTKGAGLEAFATLDDEQPLKVHFRIIDASEGEHGNIKAASDQKRFFLIHADKPIDWLPRPAGEGWGEGETYELVINFQYRTDAEKTGQDSKWQEKLLEQTELAILNALKADASASGFLQGLSRLAPTDSKAKRTLLGKYLYQYAARNTMDYFIHKDLGGFMRRELDFYIKNEIMRLDDIENADAPKVEQYLAQIRVLRRIAQQLIAFLAQLEDFQLKLWLKKKFVTETHYCITLDRVPEKFYAEIAANDKQLDEWEKLFAISEINDSAANQKCTSEFLKNNPFLLLDTALFSNDFKQQLLAELPDLDAQCDGVLIHSENFQALGLVQQKYREQVKCVHIDPPYNTSTSGFLYKNEYQHSSWSSFMFQLIKITRQLMDKKGIFQCHIDENEYEQLFMIMEELNLPNSGTVIWDKKNPMLGRKGVATQHEYILWRSFDTKPVYMKNRTVQIILGKVKELINQNDAVNDEVRKLFQKWISSFDGLTGGERAYRFIEDDGRVYRGVAMGAPEQRKDPKFHIPLVHPITKKECPVPSNGWSRTPETLQDLIEKNEILWGTNHSTQPQKKVYLTSDSSRQLSSIISDAKSGKVYLDNLGLFFPYCHPVSLYDVLFGSVEIEERTRFLDYFAGSGTTGHAVLDLNREDGGRREYILVEQGNPFDTVLKPRIQKVVYSKDWKEGKPVSREGLSHCFKTLRLESYEDTLNNLILKSNSSRDTTLANNADLQRDYLLNYFLDVETQASQSLLNIADFRDPTAYKMNIKKPGSEEQTLQAIDLIETFNWLIGLWVQNMATPHSFSAEFEREHDADLPKDQNTRLLCKRLKADNNGDYWFRLIEGYTLKVPGDNTSKVATLIVWRKQTDDAEKDNAVLQKFLLEKLQISPREHTYSVIYINGSHTLPNPVVEGEQTRVRLIEEAFHHAMWSGEAG
ncbi:MAG: site-specific DNA-methyltransferase [Methylococcales bacterium]|nr:site-specific DNA-methyltransferase [Methylococcales bacterium]